MKTSKELMQFLNHARGSTYEIRTQLRIAERLGYLSEMQSQRLLQQAAEVGRLLNGLIKSFRPACVA